MIRAIYYRFWCFFNGICYRHAEIKMGPLRMGCHSCYEEGLVKEQAVLEQIRRERP